MQYTGQYPTQLQKNDFRSVTINVGSGALTNSNEVEAAIDYLQLQNAPLAAADLARRLVGLKEQLNLNQRWQRHGEAISIAAQLGLYDLVEQYNENRKNNEATHVPEIARYFLLEEDIKPRLIQEMSPEYVFHGGVRHTDEVVATADLISALQGVSVEDRYNILMPAMLIHDLGNADGREGHEERSVEMAENALIQYGFGDHINRIRDVVVYGTKSDLDPRNELEQIAREADLSNFGRPEFHVQSHLVRLEDANLGTVKTVEDWYSKVLPFLLNNPILHRGDLFQTESARALFQEQYEKNRNETVAFAERLSNN